MAGRGGPRSRRRDPELGHRRIGRHRWCLHGSGGDRRPAGQGVLGGWPKARWEPNRSAWGAARMELGWIPPTVRGQPPPRALVTCRSWFPLPSTCDFTVPDGLGNDFRRLAFPLGGQTYFGTDGPPD